MTVVLLFMLLPGPALPDFMEIRQETRTAMAAEAWPVALSSVEKLLELAPGHPELYLTRARIQLGMGDNEKALSSLEQALALGLPVDFEEATFASLKDLEGYQSLKRKYQWLSRPWVRGVKAFEIGEKDLIPEGLTYDPKENVFYVGSVHKNKIMKVDRTGKATPFTAPQQDGLMGLAGLKVDAARRLLWACHGYLGPGSQGYTPELDGTSALNVYNLNTGKLLKKFTLPEKGHFLNDLTLSETGTAYISDSETSVIYKADPTSDSLQVFLDNPQLTGVNGITLSKDEKWLYAAAIDGLKAVNLKTGTIHTMTAPKEAALTGIDGLYTYGDRLFAVQNGLNRTAVFYLERDGKNIDHYQVLDANHPLFNVPTTGTMVGEDFYYIANSQLDAFHETGNLKKETLKPVYIIKDHQGPARLPQFLIDGTLTSREWGDYQKEAANHSGILVREDEDWVYFGMKSNIMTTLHLYLQSKDEIRVLHASASLGTAVYRRGEETWNMVEPFQWEVRDPLIRASFNLPHTFGDEAREYAKNNGWLASTMVMGANWEAELKISKKYLKEKGQRLALSYYRENEETGKRELIHYPDSAEITSPEAEATLLGGEAPDTVPFNPQGWKEN